MRIVEQTYDPAIPLTRLEEHPENPRRGDQKAVADSVEANGFYGAILIQKSTGRIIGGHTRYRVAVSEGADTIPGIWLDVSDDEARKILLADNRTADLAYYDDEALTRALALVLEEDGRLDGTGYDDTTYRLLLGQAERTDLYVGNVVQGQTPSERRPDYEATDIRSIILPYSSAVFDEVIERFGILRDRLDLKTNADVVRHLLKEAIEE